MVIGDDIHQHLRRTPGNPGTRCSSRSLILDLKFLQVPLLFLTAEMTSCKSGLNQSPGCASCGPGRGSDTYWTIWRPPMATAPPFNPKAVPILGPRSGDSS